MLNFSGLRKKDSYDEILNFIQTDKTKAKYPNRLATFLLNTPQYSSLLENSGLDEQEEQIKKAKIKATLKTSIGTQSDHISNTQANHIRALVTTNEAGTQVNPRTGNIETQTNNKASSSQGAGTNQASTPIETQTTPRNEPQVFNMAINDRQDERIERTNQIIQDTINKKTKINLKRTEISDT